MSLEGVAQTKPHLKEIIELYDKVREFSEVELSHDYGRISDERNCYVEEDVRRVLEHFSRTFGVLAEDAAALGEALRSGEVDFMQLPQLCAKGTQVSGESFSLLYIISRPFFMSLSRGIDANNIKWDEGRCPLCNSAPSLSVIEKNAVRKYHCSFCGTTGHFRRIGCPYCQSEVAEDMDIMYVEDDKGVRLDTCNKCKTFFKSIEEEKLLEHDVMELDLISLPLDIVAQQKGFMRRSPNPVGMTRFP